MPSVIRAVFDKRKLMAKIYANTEIISTAEIRLLYNEPRPTKGYLLHATKQLVRVNINQGLLLYCRQRKKYIRVHMCTKILMDIEP